MRRGRSARGYDGVGFRQLMPGERAAMDEARKRMARAFLRGDAASYGAELALIRGLLATARRNTKKPDQQVVGRHITVMRSL